MQVRANKRMRRVDGGFSLIELLAVVTIIILLASGASYVFLQQRETTRLNTSCTSLASAMRTARQGAVTKGRNHRLVIEVADIDGRQSVRYWVERPRAGTNRANAAFEGLPVAAWSNAEEVTDKSSLDRFVTVRSVLFSRDRGGEPALPPGGTAQYWFVEYNNRGSVPPRYLMRQTPGQPAAGLEDADEILVLHLTRTNQLFDYNKDGRADSPYSVQSIAGADFGLDTIGVNERKKTGTVVLLTSTGRTRVFDYGRYAPWNSREILYTP